MADAGGGSVRLETKTAPKRQLATKYRCICADHADMIAPITNAVSSLSARRPHAQISSSIS
jgi:hypothetical protein